MEIAVVLLLGGEIDQRIEDIEGVTEFIVTDEPHQVVIVEVGNVPRCWVIGNDNLRVRIVPGLLAGQGLTGNECYEGNWT